MDLGWIIAAAILAIGLIVETRRRIQAEIEREYFRARYASADDRRRATDAVLSAACNIRAVLEGKLAAMARAARDVGLDEFLPGGHEGDDDESDDDEAAGEQ